MNSQSTTMKFQAELLFDEYKKVRHVDLTLQQFTYLLNLYPALIVCMSDGVLDKEEWESVDKLAKGLTLQFSDDMEGEEVAKMEQKFRTEFMYLLENIEKWQKKFLNALKSHIEDSKLDKEFVLESMYLFANAADGISQVEQDAIDMLSERLSLNY
ncbi:MAG: tellurite resistance protein [Cyclobacteriaceae bacterium]|jgi:tellurite resistance protein